MKTLAAIRNVTRSTFTRVLALGALGAAVALALPATSQAQVGFGIQIGGPVYRPLPPRPYYAPVYPAYDYAGRPYAPGYYAQREDWRERERWQDRREDWRQDRRYDARQDAREDWRDERR